MNTQQVDITKLSVTELKALAYDYIREGDIINNNLMAISNEMKSRQVVNPIRQDNIIEEAITEKVKDEPKK